MVVASANRALWSSLAIGTAGLNCLARMVTHCLRASPSMTNSFRFYAHLASSGHQIQPIKYRQPVLASVLRARCAQRPRRSTRCRAQKEPIVLQAALLRHHARPVLTRMRPTWRVQKSACHALQATTAQSAPPRQPSAPRGRSQPSKAGWKSVPRAGRARIKILPVRFHASGVKQITTARKAHQRPFRAPPGPRQTLPSPPCLLQASASRVPRATGVLLASRSLAIRAFTTRGLARATRLRALHAQQTRRWRLALRPALTSVSASPSTTMRSSGPASIAPFVRLARIANAGRPSMGCRLARAIIVLAVAVSMCEGAQMPAPAAPTHQYVTRRRRDAKVASTAREMACAAVGSLASSVERARAITTA
jgi:hypothetical protein